MESKEISISTPIAVSVMGLVFQGYANLEGEIVYDRKQVAERIKVAESTLRDWGRLGIPKRAVAALKGGSSGKGLELAQGIVSSERGKFKARIGNSVQTLAGITKLQILAAITIAAATGNTQCQAMQDAALANIFDMAEDEALGKNKERIEYLTAAEANYKEILERRNKLKRVTQTWTKEVCGPNTFRPNNKLVYEGKTRDTYSEEDIAERHHICEQAEMLATAAKLLGMNMQDSLAFSHEKIRDKFGDVLEPQEVN